MLVPVPAAPVAEDPDGKVEIVNGMPAVGGGRC